MTFGFFMLHCALTGHELLYENTASILNIFIFRCAHPGMAVYMKMPLFFLFPFTVETSGCSSIIPSPSTGEGGVGVIFMLRCAQKGMSVSERG